MTPPHTLFFFFFFNDPATTEISPLSLHDALPICADRATGIPHFDSKFEVEQAIRQSGVPFTIVAPVFSMKKTGATIVNGTPDCRIACSTSNLLSKCGMPVARSAQIGRASCRERGEISVVAGSLKKKK